MLSFQYVNFYNLLHEVVCINKRKVQLHISISIFSFDLRVEKRNWTSYMLLDVDFKPTKITLKPKIENGPKVFLKGGMWRNRKIHGALNIQQNPSGLSAYYNWHCDIVENKNCWIEENPPTYLITNTVFAGCSLQRLF